MAADPRGMALERVRSARRWLVLGSTVAAVGWGAATTLLVAASGRAAAAWTATGAAAAPLLAWTGPAALLAAAAVAMALLWRARRVWSARRVALWIEERTPALSYTLVTASDPASGALPLALGDTIASAPVAALAPRRAGAHVLTATVALVAALLLFLATSPPDGARLAVAARGALRAAGAPVEPTDRIGTLRMRVVPPRYSGADARELDDPATVTALPGSTVTVSGAGRSAGITARFGSALLRVGDAGGGMWSATFTIGTAPLTLALRDRRFRRSVAVLPVPDAPPRVTLAAPAADTVWRSAPAAGAVTLAARASDDVRLAGGYFEYLVTSGSGESFRSRGGVAGTRPLSGRTGELGAALRLDALRLGAGDVLTIRAVVFDANTVTGPDTAVSDPRTLRVARPDELDSVAVEGAVPPPIERALLTERMLAVSAESLLALRGRTPRPDYVQGAVRIGRDQGDLRRRVYTVLYGQHEAGAESGVESDNEELEPQLAVNRDLRAAYDAMWDAERALMIADLPQALPAMRRAVAATDRARRANRLYLRGRPPTVVVNVPAVRLSGKEKGRSGTAATRSRADTARLRALAVLDATLRAASIGPAALADALVQAQVATASTNPAAAAALGAAALQARLGQDPSATLARARRLLLGAPAAGDPRVPWSGAWSGAAGQREGAP